MAIEISELSINTTITNEGEFSARRGGGKGSIENIDYDKPELDVEHLRQSILADCRVLIRDILERQRER